MKNLLVLLILSILFFSCTKEIKPHYKVIIENNREVIEDVVFTKFTSRIKSITNRFEATNENSQITLYFEENFDTSKINELILKDIKLEFWNTYKNIDIGNNLYENLNKILSDSLYPGAIAEYEEIDSIIKLNFSEEEELLFFRKRFPLSGYLYPNADAESQWIEGPILGYSRISDTSIVNEYLQKNYLKGYLPKNIDFIWDIMPIENMDNSIPLVYLYMVKKTNSRIPEINQNDIISVEQSFDSYTKNPNISLIFSKEGSQAWADMTEQSANEQTGIAICIFDKVYSAPIASARIEGGKTQITGGTFNGPNGIQIAQDLAYLLNFGGLPKTLSVKSIEIIANK